MKQMVDVPARWPEMSGDERDALVLRRAKGTVVEYLPLEALVRQHEVLFGEKLVLPTDSEPLESRR